jgi:predicted secreted protein
MNKKIIIIIIAIVLLIIASFFAYYFWPKGSAPKEGDKVKGQTMEAINGQNFLITLLGNKDSGYEWNAKYDSDAVKFVTREYAQPEGDIMNGAGFEKFTFQALKEGATEIEFVFKKPAEKDDEAIDKIYYEITVKPNI